MTYLMVGAEALRESTQSPQEPPMPATRQDTLIHFEGWDTNFREGL